MNKPFSIPNNDLEEIISWRHHLHSIPELGYKEFRTADFVAEKLKSWGLEVHTGIGETGIVAILRGKDPDAGMIALRADLDALPMDEANTFEHRSTHKGCMHACGHDGHTTMLMGAAWCLSQQETPPNASVCFIFQPAEEGGGGAARMIEDGIFDRFPVDAVFGMHNYPNVPAGHIASRVGPLMSASDVWEVHISGKGGHAALHAAADDVVSATASLVTQFNTIVSRSVSAIDPAVLSVTCIKTGEAYNVLPANALVKGCVRTLNTDVRERIMERMNAIGDGISASFGVKVEVVYRSLYPAVMNQIDAVQFALDAAAERFGEDRIERNFDPQMPSEDFSYFQQVKPGAYVMLGNGGTGAPNCQLHNPNFDFNDDILETGISYWMALAYAFRKPDTEWPLPA